MTDSSSFDVVVLGSANVDLVLPMSALPTAGETVLATGQSRNAGGKGLNQAVAAARAGARTAFIGAVGADEPGGLLRAVIAEADIDATRLRTSDDSTGLAVVAVDEDGENLIIVASGANADLRDLEPADLEVLGSAKVLVLQLEIPLDTVLAGAMAARGAGAYVVLNAAPAQPLPAELLGTIDLLVVNAHEARTLALPLDASIAQPGAEPPHVEDCAPVLLAAVPSLVITQGVEGALFARRGEEVQHQRAPVVRAVDTTGAGDTFTGALAAALARGDSLPDAVWFASAAGSLAVEAQGAVPSIPALTATRERMRAFDREDGWPDPLVARPIDLPVAVPLDADADLSVLDEAKIIAAPPDRADWPAWRAQLQAWRSSAHRRFGYDDSRYADPANAWAARCWNVAMVWLWDEALYDWENGVFDVDRLVATYADFGGLDAVVLWHAYPVIGIDDRNQFDYYRDVPGLTELMKGLQDRGIRVFLDYNPWDTGTRRAEGSDAVEVAALVTDTGADGVFLDTLKEGDATLRDKLLDLDPAPALEGESRVPTARIGDHLLSWAQWMEDSEVPGVLRARWFEQRHMMHHARRWNTDHTDELQSAWVNGVGVLIWDVVFGNWIGWSERDRSALRAMRRIQRTLGDHLVHGDWEPLPTGLTEAATGSGVYGASYTRDGNTLWALVNRGAEAYAGRAVDMSGDGEWYDLIAGTRLTADVASTVSSRIAARGIGALLQVRSGAQPPAGLDELLAAAAADPPRADANIRSSVGGPVGRGWAGGEAIAGAIRLRAAQTNVDHRRRVRETGGLFGPAYRPGTWKPLPPHLHGETNGNRSATIGAVAVDAAEVSNTEFAAFLDASGYRPQVANRFLAHWTDGRPVPGTEHEPVTFVDLDDARAYAAWRGARLPSDVEWQLAAADPAWRRRSPLVWNWTASEWRDGRTRWTFPKGGSWYAADGSDWYVEGGPQQPDWMLRLLLLGGGLSRSATIGFRCAVDLGPEPTDSRAGTTIAFAESGNG